LYILVQRPYDIGDKISFSGITDENASTGSPGWFVEGITLFKTTIRYGATNEVATFANGALQGCKVINCRRSPKVCKHLFYFDKAAAYFHLRCIHLRCVSKGIYLHTD